VVETTGRGTLNPKCMVLVDATLSAMRWRYNIGRS
jgi:hypothetical protein